MRCRHSRHEVAREPLVRSRLRDVARAKKFKQKKATSKSLVNAQKSFTSLIEKESKHDKISCDNLNRKKSDDDHEVRNVKRLIASR